VMSASFFSRRQPLISFSRAIAAKTSLHDSAWMSRVILYREANPDSALGGAQRCGAQGHSSCPRTAFRSVRHDVDPIGAFLHIDCLRCPDTRSQSEYPACWFRTCQFSPCPCRPTIPCHPDEGGISAPPPARFEVPPIVMYHRRRSSRPALQRLSVPCI
jgi:hypothetical protein